MPAHSRKHASMIVLILGSTSGIVRVFSFFFFSSRRRHTRYIGDWSSDVCSSDLEFFRGVEAEAVQVLDRGQRLLLGDRPLARRSCCADAFDVEAPRGGTRARAVLEIGRASCRERV